MQSNDYFNSTGSERSNEEGGGGGQRRRELTDRSKEQFLQFFFEGVLLREQIIFLVLVIDID